MVSLVLYCAGLGLLTFAGQPLLLPVAVAVFISGEVVMTPCFDETAKKHSTAAGMASCMGLLHLVDGLGRMLGSAFALGVYGWIRHTSYRSYYWPLVVAAFFLVSAVLHGVALVLARTGAAKPMTPAETPGVVPVSNGVAAQ